MQNSSVSEGAPFWVFGESPEPPSHGPGLRSWYKVFQQPIFFRAKGGTSVGILCKEAAIHKRLRSTGIMLLIGINGNGLSKKKTLLKLFPKGNEKLIVTNTILYKNWQHACLASLSWALLRLNHSAPVTYWAFNNHFNKPWKKIFHKPIY